MQWETVHGRDLKVGDVIAVWWNGAGGNRDTIVDITFPNPTWNKSWYDKVFPKGCCFAEFALLKCGMTIDYDDTYKRMVK